MKASNNSQKNKQYQKAFLVTDDTHSIVKHYCKQHNIKINMWVDNILRNYINSGMTNNAD